MYTYSIYVNIQTYIHICIYRIIYMCVYIVLLGYLTKPCNSCAHLNLQYMYKDSFTYREPTY